MNIAFIGIGNVGSALADNLAQRGHNVVIGARNPNSESVKAALALNSKLKLKSPSEAVSSAEVVFLATPYDANVQALSGLDLSGKILVDCTNPVGPGLTHGLQNRTSGSEEVQRLAKGAKVVKAFTIYGYENFENSSYPGYGSLRPAMLLVGDDSDAKQMVGTLAGDLGWQPIDAGPLSSALHLEHMTLLWIKMARVQGRGANFVYGLMER